MVLIDDTGFLLKSASVNISEGISEVPIKCVQLFKTIQDTLIVCIHVYIKLCLTNSVLPVSFCD